MTCGASRSPEAVNRRQNAVGRGGPALADQLGVRFRMINDPRQSVHFAVPEQPIREARTAARGRTAPFIVVESRDGLQGLVSKSVLEAWCNEGRIATVGQLPMTLVGIVSDGATLSEISRLMASPQFEVIAMTHGKTVVTLLTRSIDDERVRHDPRRAA